MKIVYTTHNFSCHSIELRENRILQTNTEVKNFLQNPSISASFNNRM